MNPLSVSIIAATKNAASTLPGLLASLEEQTCRDFELVVQDCLSEDRTLDILEGRKSYLPCLRVASEADSGIYDAWNKAVARARGKWLLFLGADDSLNGPEALARALELLEAQPSEVDFLALSLLLVLPNGTPLETWHPAASPLETLHSGMPLPHPALFYRATIFSGQEFSSFLRIAGDYEFLCRNLRQDNYQHAKLVVSCMSLGGVSTSLFSLLNSERECLCVSRRYFPGARPWKLLARMLRSAVCQALLVATGEESARRFSDLVRRLAGKPPLWTRRHCGVPLPALPQKPLFSLLIATLGRKEELARLLRSLNLQRYRNFEVLVADQNPPDYLSDVLAELSPDIPLRRLIIPAAGVSCARNALLPLAEGSLIAFPDDDCWYLPHTLERVVELFAHEAHFAGLLVGWSDEAPQGSATHTGEEATLLNRYTGIKGSTTFVQFYRAQACRDVRFDPLLGPGTGLPYGSGEDTDYLLQVQALGSQVGRTPEVLVLHPKPVYRDPDMVDKARKYAAGRMRLLRKHRYPFWFQWLNVSYPLLKALLDRGRNWPYYKTVFFYRLSGLMAKNTDLRFDEQRSTRPNDEG